MPSEWVVPPLSAHAIVADAVAAPRPYEVLRVHLRSGEWLIAKAPFYDDDERILHLRLSRHHVRALKPTEIREIAYRRAHWGARCMLGGVVFLAGVVAGAVLSIHSQLGARDGAFLGGMLGAFAAPFVVWFLQDVSPFGTWQIVPVPDDA